MFSGGTAGNGPFIKASLTFSLFAMFLMTAFLALYLPAEHSGDLQGELDQLTEGYYDITGSAPASEEVWALTGIYVPYGKGIGEDGQLVDSTAWGTTKDGWIYGARVASYSPSQFDNLNGGKEDYTVQYDPDTGLYYYVQAGEDLASVTASPADPQQGTLYTQVSMDPAYKSDLFFTPGGKVTDERGTYYQYSGYRYSFSPIRDYRASNELAVDRVTTSLSIVWYNYYGTEGLNSQLMLNGSDSGLSYITAQEIVNRFEAASFSSRFTMTFNGIDMYVYIKLNPYALQIQGYSVQECFQNGFWSIMVTSPAISTETSDFSLQAFSPDRLFEIVFNLLTFSMDGYNLSGTAALLCSLFFTVSFYTSLIAIALEHEHLLILLTLVGIIQAALILV